ncbi:hypothetical protein EVAR_9766_1 [Eumeta japonica]|uniref:Uncharacterized protein n=1 Tax=Eumeta variegata TaxID=151549 RepID=A0A4C1U5I2_EUMVA|nr:hypothetical protein EVAR_9766_1 [Eumeta japonica]
MCACVESAVHVHVVPLPGHPRAHARHRACAQWAGGGGTLHEGGEGRKQTRPRTSSAAQLRLASRTAVRSIRLKPRTLPTAARRTSMDRRPQVKAARIGDPLCVNLSERAADR